MGLEENLKKYMQSKQDETANRANTIGKFVANALPCAILFCNESGRVSADVGQVKGFFDGTHAIGLDTNDEGFDDLQFLDEFIEYVQKTEEISTRNVIVVFNANEAGILAAKITSYFEQIYFVKSAAQVSTIAKLGAMLEMYEELIWRAKQTNDSLWEIFHHLKDELCANGLDMKKFEAEFSVVSAIRYEDDVLSATIKKTLNEIRV